MKTTKLVFEAWILSLQQFSLHLLQTCFYSPICLLPSGTLCSTLVAMPYYFMGFFLPSSIWLLPNDYALSSNIQCGLFLVTLFLPYPYLYCYLVVLFLLMLQLDDVFPLPCFTHCSMPSCYHAMAFFHSIVHVLFMLSGDFIFHIFLMAFYGFPSLVCLLLGGIICPYVCC
jgi:hypothetical protein